MSVENTGKAAIGEGGISKGIDTMGSDLDLKVKDTSLDLILAGLMKEVANGIDRSGNIV